MNRELYQETFSKLRASDQAKEELMNMTEEKKAGKVRTFKVVRNVLIAAALCLALIGTAFAAGVLEIRHGMVVLGTFTRGFVYDAEGDPVFEPDPEKIASGEQIVLEPDHVAGGKLAEEDGRFILYYQYGSTEGREDITDAILENGTYSTAWEKDGYKLSITVYPSSEEEVGEGHVLLYQGTGYCLKADGKLPGGDYFTYDEDGNKVPAWHEGLTFQLKDDSSFYVNDIQNFDALYNREDR